jgi:hypothetical protein
LAILNAINRAVLASQEPVPNIEFSFSISDVADPSRNRKTIWALSRRAEEEEKWVMSDFGYWSWPLNVVGEYGELRSQIQDQEVGWTNKVPKALWRGAAGTNALRKALLKITRNQQWADVKEVFWKSATELKDSSVGVALTMPQHCGYQYLLHTEGSIVLFRY